MSSLCNMFANYYSNIHQIMIGKPCTISALQNSNVPDYADQCCLNKH